MKKKFRFMEATFEGLPIGQGEIHKFRGYIADRNLNNDYMHNHYCGTDKVIYRYPLVQYKRKNGFPFIITYGEALPSVYNAIMDIDEVIIDNRVIRDFDINIRLCEKTIGDSSLPIEYRFVSPWMGLNKENYTKYIETDEKEEILKRVLIGNILSVCSAFDVQIENKLTVDTDLSEINTFYKGVTMIAFKGSFFVNCHLPSMCGIGKGVSRGMGTIIKIDSTGGDRNNGESRVDFSSIDA